MKNIKEIVDSAAEGVVAQLQLRAIEHYKKHLRVYEQEIHSNNPDKAAMWLDFITADRLWLINVFGLDSVIVDNIKSNENGKLP